jgi:hypothetical protein
VKDEELAQMAHDLRARDATIREMADRLSETAEAAEAAAAAAMQMDRDRKAAVSEAAQARRLADSALKEAEARIKEAQEGAARKVIGSPYFDAVGAGLGLQRMETKVCSGQSALKKVDARKEGHFSWFRDTKGLENKGVEIT